MSEEARVYEVCSAIIGPTEVLKLATRIRDEVSDTPKILAIISNVENEVEEAALVEIAEDGKSVSEKPGVSGICPIYQDFDIDIQQADQKERDPFAVAGAPRQISFKITFSAEGPYNTVEVCTAEISKITDLLQECRRLQDLARQHDFSANGPSHRWLNNYSVPTSKRRPATATGIILQPNRQDSISSLLSYGSKAIEGLPALTSSFGTFNFLGSSNVKSPPSVMSVFSGATKEPRTSTEKPRNTNSEEDNLPKDIKERLHARQQEYTAVENLSVHVCTYNANGQFYNAEMDLSPWLRATDEPDLVVVGLQEMDLRPEVVLVKHDTAVVESWIQGIQSALNASKQGEASIPEDQQRRYTLLDHKQLAGIWMAVFANDRILPHMSMGDTQSTSVMTGWAGFAGNKGACAVRLRVYDTYLCFLNAHLAAGQDMTQRRNADISDIMKRLTFTNIMTDGTTFIKATDCSILTVFGDLNYRLNHTTEGVRSLLASQQYTPLLAHDQLKLSQSASLAFEGFEEGDITFPCTYKYDRNSDEYDTSEKDRRPAWTDRVLWKTYEEEVKVECLEYTNVMEMKESDHKPVIASLKMTISVVDEVKRKNILEEIQGQGNTPPTG